MPSKSAWRPSPIRSGPFPHFLCLKQRGKVWEQKSAYALDRPTPSASTPTYFFPGQTASSLERAGVKEGITALPLPHPLLHLLSFHQSEETAQLPRLPTSLQVRPLSQGLALRTYANLKRRPRVLGKPWPLGGKRSPLHV